MTLWHLIMWHHIRSCIRVIWQCYATHQKDPLEEGF